VELLTKKFLLITATRLSNCNLFDVIIFFLISCTSTSTPPNTNKEEKKQTSPHDIRKKPPSSFNDTIMIGSKSAVFFKADSVQMKKIKQVNDESVFESLTHDCYYQMRNAKQVIQKERPEIKIILASTVRFLIFTNANGNSKTIDLNQVNDICGIFLFDPAKDPVRINMTNIDSELGFYFRK
jgi:hypothetical protein